MSNTKAKKEMDSPVEILDEGLTFSGLTPKDLEAGTSRCIERAKKVLDAILSAETNTVENTLAVLDGMGLDMGNVGGVLSKLKNLHPQEDIRNEAGNQLAVLSNFSSTLGLNPDLAAAVKAVDVSGSDKVTQRLKEHSVRDFKRAGALEDEETRNRLLELKNKLTELSIKFSGNYNNAVGKIHVDESELSGLSKDTIESFERGDDGKLTVTTRYPDYFPVMQECSNAEVRKKLQEISSTLAPENHDILIEVLKLRRQIASILGYKDAADFALEVKMTKNSETVTEFLEFLDEATRERSAYEVAELEKEKQAEGFEDVQIKQYDAQYYTEKVKERRFSLDTQKAKEYFPYEIVRDGILNLYGELFGIEFIPYPEADVWSPDVLCYKVIEDGETIALYYLDMHPREGKYQHAACGEMKQGVAGKEIPHVVLMCNFPKGLMQFTQVNTFFHEFGHGIHGIFAGNGRWAEFAGVSTEWDFVEAPSQLLEEWLRDKQIIQRISSHYETGDAIPAEIIDAILAAENYGAGFFVRRQLFLSVFAFELHLADPENLDIAELLQDVADKYCPYPISRDAHFWTTFGHLLGYGPAYYTYMWSKVISKDLLTQFDLNNLMDPEIADKYRRKILEPGGSKDAADLVADFLRRPYSFDPYKEWLTSNKEDW